MNVPKCAASDDAGEQREPQPAPREYARAARTPRAAARAPPPPCARTRSPARAPRSRRSAAARPTRTARRSRAARDRWSAAARARAARYPAAYERKAARPAPLGFGEGRWVVRGRDDRTGDRPRRMGAQHGLRRAAIRRCWPDPGRESVPSDALGADPAARGLLRRTGRDGFHPGRARGDLRLGGGRAAAVRARALRRPAGSSCASDRCCGCRRATSTAATSGSTATARWIVLFGRLVPGARSLV